LSNQSGLFVLNWRHCGESAVLDSSAAFGSEMFSVSSTENSVGDFNLQMENSIGGLAWARKEA
jgi:hypothetical protein